eukprot:m.34892 g.34892  ORF g.34892 m.34892 type:complete len:163 (-) comp12719_c0_seq4:1396-1884(-)
MATATRWAGRWLRTQAVLQRKRATSLRIASLDPASVIDLDLSGSKDFVCTNLVCGKFNSVCVCKLARWIFQSGPGLVNLRSLSVKGNNLDVIPDPVWTLTQLEELDLSGNNLTEIPHELVNLTNLRRLDLSNNRLTKAPTALELMSPTLVVSLDGNPCVDDN